MKVISLSNYIEILHERDACDTSVISYSSSINSFDFDYSDIGSTTQTVRLHLYRCNPQGSLQEKIYRGSNGVFQNNNVKIDKTYELMTGYFDEKTHNALEVASKHSTFKVDNIEYSAQGNYDRDDRTDLTLTNLSTARIKVFAQGYNKTNLSC